MNLCVYAHGGDRTEGNDGVRCVEGQALAKLNLTLDVLGKRTDGYHDLRM